MWLQTGRRGFAVSEAAGRFDGIDVDEEWEAVLDLLELPVRA
jgi:hypothetical protein